ncbi:MBL fold metallo-hydrolase, partial [Paraclostridium bifermentans]
LASGSKGNCYLLQLKDETLILECGIRFREIVEGLDFDLENVVG